VTSPLLKDFELFLEQAMDLQALVWTFSALFEQGSDQDSLMRDTAGHFFEDLNGWMIELYFVKAARLTDRAYHGKSANITVCFLLRSLEDQGAIPRDVQEYADKLNAYGKQHLAPARHKVIAHLDAHCLRSKQTMGEHTYQELAEFLKNLQRFCDAVALHLGSTPVCFQSNASEYDVFSLINALETGQDPHL
jgi:hypothetical protein